MMTRHTGRRAAHQKGLTLVELIIALTLTSLILVAVFSGLQLAARANERVQLQRDTVGDTALIRDWIIRQLSQAEAIIIEPQPQETMAAFWGEPDQVRFVAPLPAHLGGGGLSLLTLGVAESQGDRQLALEYGLFHPDADNSGADVKRRVLLEEIERVEFAYYGALEENQAPEWHERWQGAKTIPMRITLSIQFKSRRHRWVKLLATPMIDGPEQRQSRWARGRG